MMTDKPDITIGKLHIWVHGKEFPSLNLTEQNSYDDAGWLRATISYRTACSTVEISGAALHHCDLKALQDDCQKLHTNGHGLLQFGTLEPHLHVELKSDSLGHLKGVIVLRPDPVYEKHEYVVEDLDLSYLPKIISECKDAIITHFPETVKTK